jgi:hypothetical protein
MPFHTSVAGIDDPRHLKDRIFIFFSTLRTAPALASKTFRSIALDGREWDHGPRAPLGAPPN